MTPARFRELREHAGLSIRDLADALRMTGRHADSHLREMEDGVRTIPGPTGLALEALADGWRPGSRFYIAGEGMPSCEVIEGSETLPVQSVAVRSGCLRIVIGEPA